MKNLDETARELARELIKITHQPISEDDMVERFRVAIICAFAPVSVLSEGTLGNDGGADHECG